MGLSVFIFIVRQFSGEVYCSTILPRKCNGHLDSILMYCPCIKGQSAIVQLFYSQVRSLSKNWSFRSRSRRKGELILILLAVVWYVPKYVIPAKKFINTWFLLTLTCVQSTGAHTHAIPGPVQKNRKGKFKPVRGTQILLQSINRRESQTFVQWPPFVLGFPQFSSVGNVYE